MSKQDVDAILRAAKQFLFALGQANVKLDFRTEVCKNNRPIAASMGAYCDMITGRNHVLSEPPPSPRARKDARIRLRETRSSKTDTYGSIIIDARHGVVSIPYDDCSIRRGISPRWHRWQAIELGKTIASYLRELEASGDLLVDHSEGGKGEHQLT